MFRQHLTANSSILPLFPRASSLLIMSNENNSWQHRRWANDNGMDIDCNIQFFTAWLIISPYSQFKIFYPFIYRSIQWNFPSKVSLKRASNRPINLAAVLYLRLVLSISIFSQHCSSFLPNVNLNWCLSWRLRNKQSFLFLIRLYLLFSDLILVLSYFFADRFLETFILPYRCFSFSLLNSKNIKYSIFLPIRSIR